MLVAQENLTMLYHLMQTTHMSLLTEFETGNNVGSLSLAELFTHFVA